MVMVMEIATWLLVEPIAGFILERTFCPQQRRCVEAAVAVGSKAEHAKGIGEEERRGFTRGGVPHATLMMLLLMRRWMLMVRGCLGEKSPNERIIYMTGRHEGLFRDHTAVATPRS